MENSKKFIGVNWIDYCIDMCYLGTNYNNILISVSYHIGYTGDRVKEYLMIKKGNH